MGERRCRSRQRSHSDRPRDQRPLYTVTLGRPRTSHALQTAERLGLPAAVVAAARGKIAPERLQIATLVEEAEEAAREAQAVLSAAAAEQREAAAAHRAAERAEQDLRDEIEHVRSSAAAERQRALAQAETDLAVVRGELEELRADIRVARRLERQRGRTATPDQQQKEKERIRLGAASERASRAARSMARLDEPGPSPGPLGVGDPVVAPALGVRGTISEIVGDEAIVLGSGGLRVRVALDRLRPDRDGRRTRRRRRRP